MPRLTCHGLFLAPWGSDLRLVLLPSSQLESSSLHREAGTWASCPWRQDLDAAVKGEGPGLLSPLLTGTDCHTRRTHTGLTATAVTPAFLCRPSWGVGQRPGHASLAWGGGDPPPHRVSSALNRSAVTKGSLWPWRWPRTLIPTFQTNCSKVSLRAATRWKQGGTELHPGM